MRQVIIKISFEAERKDHATINRFAERWAQKVRPFESMGFVTTKNWCEVTFEVAETRYAFQQACALAFILPLVLKGLVPNDSVSYKLPSRRPTFATPPDPATMEVALKRAATTLSILKWEGLKPGHIERGGPSCALCVVDEVQGAGNCASCPIFEYTGKIGCISTPYQRWGLHHSEDHDHDPGGYRYISECEECEALISQEVSFLEAILMELHRGEA